MTTTEYDTMIKRAAREFLARALDDYARWHGGRKQPPSDRRFRPLACHCCGAERVPLLALAMGDAATNDNDDRRHPWSHFCQKILCERCHRIWDEEIDLGGGWLS